MQNGKANIENVVLLSGNEENIYFVEYEQKVILRMAFEVNEDLKILDYGYQIRNENGVDIIHSDSIIENKSLINVKKGERFVVDWHFKISLSHISGKYTVLTGLVILPFIRIRKNLAKDI